MPKNYISLETAQSWAREYRHSSTTNTIGFVIPRANLEQLLACPDGVDVCAYLGINAQGEETLMFVSTDANGRDLIDAANGQFIYDYSRKCPPAGDGLSPLYNE